MAAGGAGRCAAWRQERRVTPAARPAAGPRCVFQLHWVDLETGEMADLRLSRAKFLEHFANRAACVVGMEACGGSQHWAWRPRELGHEVCLVSAKMVRAFVGGNKNDATDARAIWTAVQPVINVVVPIVLHGIPQDHRRRSRATAYPTERSTRTFRGCSPASRLRARTGRWDPGKVGP